MFKRAHETIKSSLKKVFLCSLGFSSIIGLIIIAIVSLPVFLYRWVICQVLAPLCGRDLGKAVTVASSATGTELGHDKGRSKPRCAIVLNVVFKGSLSFDDVADLIKQNWITAVDPATGKLKYPEFQQFVESWMSYLFWKKDKSFNLQNHLVHQRCEESWTEMKCEKYACGLSEELLNKPFPQGRSPWEVHMISNFKKSEMTSGENESGTILVFRFHHCMADGFGVLSALMGLLKIPISNCEIATASKNKSKLDDAEAKINCFKKFLNCLRFSIKAMEDIGFAIGLTLMPVKNPFYIPEDKRTGHLFYIRSEKILMSKLKFVKDRLGVSFTATILSSIGAGISISNKSKEVSNRIKELPFGSPLPLQDHPNKLRNHATAALYDVPIDQLLSPLERLMKSEKLYQKAKQSTYPYLAPFGLKLAAAQLPLISRTLLTNRTLSTGMTNFPGPGVPISALGRKIIEIDFGAGLLPGVAGVGFMVLSYQDHLRISIVAENAALERHELMELVKAISYEIDILYELAKRDLDVKICMADCDE